MVETMAEAFEVTFKKLEEKREKKQVDLRFSCRIFLLEGGTFLEIVNCRM